MDSIDATIRSGDSMRTQFDVQLKATSTPDKKDDGLHFRLSRKNYDDLTAARTTPLMLLVLELPSDETEWLECSVEHLTMRRCCWWASLSGSESTDAGSKTIVIPTAQRLGPWGIVPLMAAAEGREAMNIQATDIALAGTVTPRGVHAYLAANGWTKIGPCHGTTGDVYCLPEDEREAVLVPASTTFADYVTRLMQLAEALGRVENRRQSMVLTDLSLAEVDLIRVRLPKAYDDSSIPSLRRSWSSR